MVIKSYIISYIYDMYDIYIYVCTTSVVFLGLVANGLASVFSRQLFDWLFPASPVSWFAVLRTWHLVVAPRDGETQARAPALG